MKAQISDLNVDELQRRVHNREVSSVEIVEDILARINALNPRINAFALVLAEQARAAAAEADAEIRRGAWRGPLHGVPVGVKDFYDTAGVPTTAAFERFRDRVPRKDAVGVARLKEAGAIIIGKMNMHTLGTGTTGLESMFGAARNPMNEDYIPGGSSSGSAAAVATGMCYATLDTDAIGSVRLPAACCGVVGFKGTYGLISTQGILDGEPVDEAIKWLGHAGITTRSVADTRIMAGALAGPERRSAFDASVGANFRVGVAENATADADVMRAFDAAVDVMRSSGHEPARVRVPFSVARFDQLQNIETDRRSISDRLFRDNDIDVLMLPTLTTVVPRVEAMRFNATGLSPALTMFANYFGLPAISVPCGRDHNGLPIGLQFVGRPWDDSTVLHVAQEYESHRGR